MKRLLLAAGAAILLASACSEKKIDATAEAVSAEDRAKYADNATDKVDLAKDSGLVQLLCVNGMDAKCPEGFEAKLKEYGFDGDGTAVDLADAMIKIYADDHDKTPDQYSEDEDYFVAAYQVILNREPDESGRGSNLALIQENPSNRRVVVRAMLQSEEFRAMSAPTLGAPVSPDAPPPPAPEQAAPPAPADTSTPAP